MLSSQGTKKSLTLDLCSKESFSLSGKQQWHKSTHLKEGRPRAKPSLSYNGEQYKQSEEWEIKLPGGNGSLDLKEKDIWAEERVKTEGREGQGEFA